MGPRTVRQRECSLLWVDRLRAVLGGDHDPAGGVNSVVGTSTAVIGSRSGVSGGCPALPSATGPVIGMASGPGGVASNGGGLVVSKFGCTPTLAPGSG